MILWNIGVVRESVVKASLRGGLRAGANPPGPKGDTPAKKKSNTASTPTSQSRSKSAAKTTTPPGVTKSEGMEQKVKFLKNILKLKLAKLILSNLEQTLLLYLTVMECHYCKKYLKNYQIKM